MPERRHARSLAASTIGWRISVAAVGCGRVVRHARPEALLGALCLTRARFSRLQAGLRQRSALGIHSLGRDTPVPHIVLDGTAHFTRACAHAVSGDAEGFEHMDSARLSLHLHHVSARRLQP